MSLLRAGSTASVCRTAIVAQEYNDFASGGLRSYYPEYLCVGFSSAVVADRSNFFHVRRLSPSESALADVTHRLPCLVVASGFRKPRSSPLLHEPSSSSQLAYLHGKALLALGLSHPLYSVSLSHSLSHPSSRSLYVEKRRRSTSLPFSGSAERRTPNFSSC